MRCSFRITYFHNIDNYVSRSVNENIELTNKLFQYYNDLGVEAYEADTENLEETVRWRLQGEWYSTAQIERIRNLRAFL
jgi:hypothetical protein